MSSESWFNPSSAIAIDLNDLFVVFFLAQKINGMIRLVFLA